MHTQLTDVAITSYVFVSLKIVDVFFLNYEQALLLIFQTQTWTYHTYELVTYSSIYRYDELIDFR